MKFKKGETIIYPQHGACIVMGTKKMEAFGEKREYLILQTVINEMTLKVPVDKAEEVGVRPPVSADELEDLVAVLSKPDPRVPSNWSRRFKNHQEKLKSGDVYQVAEVVRNLAARNRDASLSAAERTMYERARVNLVSEISPALKVSAEDAEAYLDEALAKGVLKPAKEPPPPRRSRRRAARSGCRGHHAHGGTGRDPVARSRRARPEALVRRSRARWTSTRRVISASTRPPVSSSAGPRVVTAATSRRAVAAPMPRAPPVTGAANIEIWRRGRLVGHPAMPAVVVGLPAARSSAHCSSQARISPEPLASAHCRGRAGNE